MAHRADGLSDIFENDITVRGDIISPSVVIWINHGSTSATNRPITKNIVIWIGSVEPTNATDNDLWIKT